jgi:hypothetical protein
VTVAAIQNGYLVSAPAFPASGVPHEYGRITGYGYPSLPLQSPNPVDSAFFGSRMAALGGPWVVVGDTQSGLETNFVFANGILNRTIPGAGDFAGAGDVDNDGVPELLTVNATNGASVLSFSSFPSVELATLDYPSTARFVGPQVFVYPGVTVTGLGDVDKDGIPDLLTGSPALDVGPNQKQGRVFLFLSGRNR